MSSCPPTQKHPRFDAPGIRLIVKIQLRKASDNHVLGKQIHCNTNWGMQLLWRRSLQICWLSLCCIVWLCLVAFSDAAVCGGGSAYVLCDVNDVDLSECPPLNVKWTICEELVHPHASRTWMVGHFPLYSYEWQESSTQLVCGSIPSTNVNPIAHHMYRLKWTLNIVYDNRFLWDYDSSLEWTT